MNTHLAWHQPVWDKFARMLKQDAMPHALLLSGPEGVGKSYLVKQLAAQLFCEQTTGELAHCGVCPACQLMQAGSHPDFRWVTRELTAKNELSKEIRVDQVRDTIHWLGLTSHSGRRKMVVIEPAERMNWNAANALLKSLEEPPAGTLIVLITAVPGQLAATVRSRCQQIKIALPEKQQGLSWLQSQLDKSDDVEALLAQGGGAPFKALALKGDTLRSKRAELLQGLIDLRCGKAEPVGLAASWVKLGPEPIIEWLQVLILDLMRMQVSSQTPWLDNPDLKNDVESLKQSLQVAQLQSLQQHYARSLTWLKQNVNTELVMEDALIKWSRA